MARSNTLASLQTALDSTRAAPPAPKVRQVLSTPPDSTGAIRQANRLGKVNIAAWMDPAFKNSIRLVQARRPGSIQQLMEEALNDLFAKYDVPQVATAEE